MSFAIWYASPPFGESTLSEGERIYARVGGVWKPIAQVSNVDHPDLWVVTDEPEKVSQTYVEGQRNDAVRAAQVRSIEAVRNDALLAGVSWNAKDWHIDQTFQDHLTGLVAAFAAGILPADATVPIRTRANTVENLTYAQLKQLAAVVLARVQQIWSASWAAKDAL